MQVELINLIDHFPPPDGSAAGFSALTCKFVVIARPETLSLVMGLYSEYPWHAGLIRRFCRDRNIKSTWVKQPDVIKILDKAVCVRGGGWAEIVSGTKTLTVYGRSNAYGPFDPVEARSVLSGSSLFTSYKIHIET
jgi:hypothetical protein